MKPFLRDARATCHSILTTLVVACTTCLVPQAPAHAADAVAPLPFQDFARQPKLSQLKFSPSGQRFGAIRRDDDTGRLNLVVGDLNKGQLSQLTSFTNTDVQRYAWVGENRLILNTYQSDKGLMEQKRAGIWMAINADGTDGVPLNNGKGILDLIASIPGQDTDILVESPARDRASPDVVRLNTYTGKSVIISQLNPGHVQRWVLDSHQIPRAAESCEGEAMECSFWWRGDGDAKWEKVGTYDDDGPRMRPLAFLADGTLLVESSLSTQDRTVVQRFDPVTRQPGTVVAESPGSDANASPVIDRSTHALLGLRLEGDLPKYVWFDEATANIHALLSRELPAGSDIQLTRLENGHYAVSVLSDRVPVTYYLLDPAAMRLEKVLQPQDWIAPDRMASRQPFRYPSRDGMTIPAYLTLPADRPAQKLPLIAWIHGGPWARDTSGWDTAAQFFASRGYAVFQPNYRGSTGYGLRHLKAGYKQLGQTMQDDITDGVQDLIRRGIVDPQRVCIGGASYGGYATLMGLVREPGLFKCGIDVMGVTDLEWWQSLGDTDFNLTNPNAATVQLNKMVGKPGVDDALLHDNSPRFLAAKMKAPVLIVHGSNDPRVPLRHAEAMRSALTAAGHPPEWVVYAGEGHGFLKPENRIDYYQHMAVFLDRWIGPASAAAASH
jgi:dipeptidyl aminopeptidase/acylaminoacyl peptidase